MAATSQNSGLAARTGAETSNALKITVDRKNANARKNQVVRRPSRGADVAGETVSASALRR